METGEYESWKQLSSIGCGGTWLVDYEDFHLLLLIPVLIDVRARTIAEEKNVYMFSRLSAYKYIYVCFYMGRCVNKPKKRQATAWFTRSRVEVEVNKEARCPRKSARRAVAVARLSDSNNDCCLHRNL